jgi:hypothetical protein
MEKAGEHTANCGRGLADTHSRVGAPTFFPNMGEHPNAGDRMPALGLLLLLAVPMVRFVGRWVAMIRVAAYLSVVLAWTAIDCGGDDDPRAEASQYAIDPIPCLQDSDCCVVNDSCHSTAYVVASKDTAKVSSLIASADNSTCDRCVTPMLQVSCVSGACLGERIDFACSLPIPYPGNHCGKIELPASCLSSTTRDDAGTSFPDGGTSKPLAIFRCGS